MKKTRIIKTFLRLLSASLVICLLLTLNHHIITVNAATTFQASTAFNNGLGIQGKDMWYYQQWNGSSYSDLTWDNTNQYWQGSSTWLRIWSTTMHPEAGYDAVRKWVAPCDGDVELIGNVKKHDTSGGDGVAVLIKYNTSTIWSDLLAYDDSTGKNYDLDQSVKAGDAIYFIVSRRTTISCDSTYWNPSVSFTPLVSGTSAKEWNFTSSLDGWGSAWHCSISASGGYLNGTLTDSNPSIISGDNQNLDITKSCVLKIKMKNSTSSTDAAIYFITNDDTVYTQSKCKAFVINANDANYTEYTIDMSGTYGWLGKLKQVRLNPNYASSGSFSIDYIKLQSGGSNVPDFSLLDKETVLNSYTITTVNGMTHYNDSSYGVLRNSDATYTFFGSNGIGTNRYNSTISCGTLDNPFSVSLDKNVTIDGLPAAFSYSSIGPSYRDPTDSDTIMGFVHVERHYYVASVKYAYCSLGIAISRDNADTWDWCGEIISPDLEFDDTRARSSISGAGSYLIQDVSGVDYFYVYMIDHPSSTPSVNGLSVSRASISSVLTAAKNETVTSWYKYYNSAWNSPGINGNYTNLASSSVYMNAFSVSYNTYLDKYLLAYCTAKEYDTNYADISLIVADSCLDFNNNATEHLVDSGTKYTQYPSIVGFDNDAPQPETQKNFYIYYTQWDDDLITNPTIVRKMVILD